MRQSQIKKSKAQLGNRIEFIDIARGISIVLVAMGHSKLVLFFPFLIESMSLFRMPLFFLLAGLFFNWQQSPKVFTLKKFETLLKPYFVVLFIILFIDFIWFSPSVSYELKGIFYGNSKTIKYGWRPLWFLSHLFAVYCFCYCLFKIIDLTKAHWLASATILVSFIFVGTSWVDYFWYKEIQILSYSAILPGLPFSIDIILISSFYFIVGKLLFSQLNKLHFTGLYFLLSVVIFSCVVLLSNSSIDLNHRIHSATFYVIIGAFSGIYIIFSISYALSKNRVLSMFFRHLGKSSLFILIFHYVIQTKVYDFLSKEMNGSFQLILCAFISLIVAITISLALKKLVESNSLLSIAFLPYKSKQAIKKSIFGIQK